MTPIVNAYVEDDGRFIVAIEQSEEGIRERRVRAEYTTFHKKGAIDEKLIRLLKHSPAVSHLKEVGSFLRIGWRSDNDRRQARYKFRDEGIATFEGDVDPVRYWLTESKVTIAKPRRCYLDIEADSRVPFSKKEEMRILCWALSDDTGPIARGVLKEDTDASERVLLQKLWKQLDNYDQVCAWYGGDPDEKGEGFDFFVIAKRSTRLGLPIDTRRWLWLDQLVAWKRMNQHTAESGAEKESHRLEDIAQSQIGEGKDKTPDWVIDRFGDKNLGAITWDLWQAGGEFRKLLVQYCVKDTELLRKLEIKKGFLTLFQTLCEVCACFANTRSLQPTIQMDGFLFKLGRDRDYRFPTKWYSEDKPSEKFRGAYVMHPRTVGDTSKDSEWSPAQADAWRKKHNVPNGILRNVHVCDFTSLYPTIIITWNLSEDVKCDDPEIHGALLAGAEMPENVCRSPGTGVLTYTDKRGILTEALATMLDLRKEWSKKSTEFPPGTPDWQDAMARSNAYKVAANSFYGVTGASSSRYFNRDLAESTTQNGVWLIKHTIKEAEKREMVAVYSDTDSVFVIGPTREGYTSFIRWCNSKLYPKIIAETGTKENRISVAFEKTFSRLVFTAAKRYIGRYSQYKGKEATADSKPEIKGLEYKRGDTSFLARKLQGQIIDLLVGGVKEKDPDGKEVSVNPDIETPTEDVKIYERVLAKMRNYVLNEKMPSSEIRLSQSISKPLKEYKVKTAHIGVAQILQERGRDISPGTRIEYVVVDGSCSPLKVIPFEDFNGEFDRFYLWDTLVYPPTQRLLEAAFPDHDWQAWANVRPPKPKKRGKKALEGQLGLSLSKGSSTQEDGDLAVPTYSSQPLIVRVPEKGGTKILEKLKKTFKAHPGARAVEFIIMLDSGAEAILKTPLRVATGPALKESVDEILAENS